jgi:hypothetical protein
MKLFLGFLFLAVALGLLLRRRSLRARAVVVVGLCALVCAGYFFFNQI